MHDDCFASFFSALVKRHFSYMLQQRPSPTNVDKGEFFCPVCRRLSNALIPIIPKEYRKNIDSLHFSLFSILFRKRLGRFLNKMEKREKWREREHWRVLELLMLRNSLFSIMFRNQEKWIENTEKYWNYDVEKCSLVYSNFYWNLWFFLEFNILFNVVLHFSTSIRCNSDWSNNFSSKITEKILW